MVLWVLVFSYSCSVLEAYPGILTADAALSSRWAKPRQGVELLVSVRNAHGRLVVTPVIPRGMIYRPLKTFQRIECPEGEILLFRYRITSLVCGDYEIPPVRVANGSSTVLTRPLFLKVSNDGKPHPMRARELGIAASIPEPLATEAVKLLPPIAASPSPSPRGASKRLDVHGVLSSVLHGFKWFWDYP